MRRRTPQKILLAVGVLALTLGVGVAWLDPYLVERTKFASAAGQVADVCYGPGSEEVYCFSDRNAGGRLSNGGGSLTNDESFCYWKAVGPGGGTVRRLECWPYKVVPLAGKGLLIGGATNLRPITPFFLYSAELFTYDPATRRKLTRFVGHRMAIQSLDLSPDGRRFVTGTNGYEAAEGGRETWETASQDIAGDYRPISDKTLALWDIERGEPLAMEYGHGLGQRRKGYDERSFPYDVQAVAFSPDGKRVVSGGADSRVRVWDVSKDTLAPLGTLGDSGHHERPVVAVAFVCGGEEVLSQDASGLVQVRAFPTGEVLRQVQLAGPTITRPKYAIVASPDGSRFADTGGEGVVLYDAATLKPAWDVPTRLTNPSSKAFSPDGKYLAIGSTMPTGSGVEQWDIAGRQPRAQK